MKEDKTAVKNSAAKENEPIVENGKKKTKEERPATKIVVRRLPPTMTEEQFKMQVSPLPDIDYFYFVPADMTLSPNAFSRAYLNFVDQTDLFIFTEKFDGYVFVDGKGVEFPAVVEFAPFQRIPKNRPNRKKDPKTGTIEADPVYIAFKEQLEAESLENRTAANASKQHFFETSLVPEKKEVNNTPLLDFVRNRKAERQRIREEKREEKRKKDLERRKAKEEQRRSKKEEETAAVVKTYSPSPAQPKVQPPAQPSLTEACPKHNITEGKIVTETAKPFTSSKDEKEDPGVPKKVRELVNFFNKSITETNKKGWETNNAMNISLKNCVKHKDIESEIIKTAGEKNEVRANTSLGNTKVIAKTWPLLSFPVPTSHFNESNNISPHFNPLPIMITSSARAHNRVFVPYSHRPCVRNIVMKPIKIGTPLQQNVITKKENDVKREEVKKTSSTTVFPADVFRKNLEKVVADVLGNSKVKTPKENIIGKPKTFVKRAFANSGEQCGRPGFNSPNFYLPPRSFGCGPSESMIDTSKGFPHSDRLHQTQKPLKTTFSGKGHFTTFSRKTLPPFSKKSLSSSKSDGDIETNDNDHKLGGSVESLERKIEPWALKLKPHLVRRPHVAPKKSVILEKHSKVTL